MLYHEIAVVCILKHNTLHKIIKKKLWIIKNIVINRTFSNEYDVNSVKYW